MQGSGSQFSKYDTQDFRRKNVVLRLGWFPIKDPAVLVDRRQRARKQNENANSACSLTKERKARHIFTDYLSELSTMYHPPVVSLYDLRNMQTFHQKAFLRIA